MGDHVAGGAGQIAKHEKVRNPSDSLKI